MRLNFPAAFIEADMHDTPTTTGIFPVPTLLKRVLAAPTGWTLEAFCMLDEAQPGLLRFATSSRPEWRHAVAMAIANGLFDHSDRLYEAAAGEPPEEGPWSTVLAQVATILTIMEPKAIIEASFGTCPDGIVGALRKLDFEPVSRDAFLALHAIFVDPAMSVRRKAIMQLPRLDQDLLEAACTLDVLVLSPGLIGRAKSRSGAERINRQLSAIRRHCSTATDEALMKSLSDLGPDTSAEGWARSWLSRADQNVPPPPWPGNGTLVPLNSGDALNKAARATRTCVRSRIHYVLEGRAAYYLDVESRVIACVVLTTSGWIATQVVAEGNGVIPPDIQKRVFDTLEANGIACFRPVRHGPNDLGLVRRNLWGLGEFEVDEAELDGPLR